VAWQEERVPDGEYLASCAANTTQLAYCVEAPQVRAELVRQVSDAPCREGKSWGVDAQGLWLSRGCMGDFLLKHETDDRRDAVNARRLVECKSADRRRSFCATDARGGATLAAVLGHSPCKQGESWDWNEGGVWVDHGCSGIFELAGIRDSSGAPALFPRCYLSVGEPLASEWEAECYALHLGKQVSCNARSSCAELTANIRRGCRAKGDVAPKFCAKYFAGKD